MDVPRFSFLTFLKNYRRSINKLIDIINHIGICRIYCCFAYQMKDGINNYFSSPINAFDKANSTAIDLFVLIYSVREGHMN